MGLEWCRTVSNGLKRCQTGSNEPERYKKGRFDSSDISAIIAPPRQGIMASVIIHNIDQDLKNRLRRRLTATTVDGGRASGNPALRPVPGVKKWAWT
jgi:hypothetical protein